MIAVAGACETAEPRLDRCVLPAGEYGGVPPVPDATQQAER
jgi:hypothetical protein